MSDKPLRIGMALGVVLGVAAAAGAAPASPKAGVYQYVIHKAQGTPAEVAAAIAEAAPGAGFEVLAVVPVGSPEGCGVPSASIRKAAAYTSCRRERNEPTTVRPAAAREEAPAPSMTPERGARESDLRAPRRGR